MGSGRLPALNSEDVVRLVVAKLEQVRMALAETGMRSSWREVDDAG